MLTEREKQVLAGLKRGLCDREVGEELGISEETVAFHLRNIFAKFGVRNRTDAVLHWMEEGDEEAVK